MSSKDYRCESGARHTLRAASISKATAYVGLLTGALMVIPATVGTLGLMLSLVSLVPTVAWLIMIARELFRLSRLSAASA